MTEEEKNISLAEARKICNEVVAVSCPPHFVSFVLFCFSSNFHFLQVDELLSDGREFLLCTQRPTYLDFHLASMIAIVLTVPQYSGGVLTSRWGRLSGMDFFHGVGRGSGQGQKSMGRGGQGWVRQGAKSAGQGAYC